MKKQEVKEINDVIRIEHLTKDYGENRGIFDINLTIHKGEMIGFVGTNGSGKTTTIRNIMGFLKPTSGHVYVNDLEAWTHSSEIVKNIGYVPGEIAFPDLRTGSEFLKSLAEFLDVKDKDYANGLISKLQLDPRASLKRMSKGMKQKTAIVAALMADHDIIILDEPTTGLDPLMREAFLEIIKEEHKKGKTIFMSSHMFEELERTCNKVALIKDGHLVDMVDMDKIRNRDFNEYKVEFTNAKDYQSFKKLGYNIIRDQEKYHQVTIQVSHKDTSKLFGDLVNYDVKFISEIKYSLERYFKNKLKEIKEQEKERSTNV